MIKRILIFVVLVANSILLPQSYLGGFTKYSLEGKSVRVFADSSSFRFTFYKPDVLRVDYLPYPGTTFSKSFSVVQDTIDNMPFTLSETDSAIEITSSALKIVCKKFPLRLSYYNNSNDMILSEPNSGGIAISAENRIVNFNLNDNDHFYGTGERGTKLDKKGLSFESFNTQNYGYSSPLNTMNINIPFLASTRGYALYFENTYPGKFDLGYSTSTQFSYTARGGELSYFLIVSPIIAGQLEKYTWLTGRQPLPPRWAFGYLQSKYGYKNETEARSIISRLRQDEIPCDALILDLYWFENMGNISWNFASWPDPFKMMRDFLDEGIKTIAITEPYITEKSINFSEASSKGFLAKNSFGNTYLLSGWWSCGCNAALLDLTNPSAQTWWWNKHPAFFGEELAGIWTDLGEPEQHPSEMKHYEGSRDKVHNIYNLLWAKTIFEGYNKFRPNQRIFNLTRSGYAGAQRYGVITWSGDVGTSFDGLAVQLPMLLNMGISGLAYHNSDIGGFTGPSTPELYVRWMQYGTFCPITRAHGVGRETAPWGYGAEAETISKNFIQLRYRLLPYIYTMAYENYKTGMPLARPLFFDFPDDESLYNESSSYMWGDAFLVSPVVQSNISKKSIYLPNGKWVDYWTDIEFEGGKSYTVDAPINRMPLFVKAGSIVPMQPLMSYTDQFSLDTLTLLIYPSLGIEKKYTLYEDDGKTLAYQNGSFALTNFTQLVTGTELNSMIEVEIGTSTGNYEGKPAKRIYVIEIHSVNNKPQIVSKNGILLNEQKTYQLLRSSYEGYYYDASLKRLYVQTTTVLDSSYSIVINGVVLSAEDEGIKPKSFELMQNYPNPFNSSTVISYKLPALSHVILKVFDILGNEVSTLVEEDKPAGIYTVEFNGKNLSSGVYFYRLHANSKENGINTNYSDTKKFILVK